MKRSLHLIVLAGMGVMLSSGASRAADVGVLGTKLIIVDKGVNGAKAVFVAKDINVTKGTGTDATTIGATLDITYDNGTDASTSGAFLAPAGSPNWVVNKTTVAKYVNKQAPTGGGTKVSVIKPTKLLKLVGKNLGDTPIDILSQSGADSGTARTQYRITDSSTGFDSSFCSTFNGCAWKSIAGGTGAKLVCKGGAADPTCGGVIAPPVEVQGALAQTNGLFNFNLTLGIPGANAACNSAFAGTHACSISELQGAPASDLAGLKDTSNATVTSFWAIDNTHAAAVQCNDSLGSLQNWEYATAHTGVFAESMTLNNPTGVLGPVAGAICASSSWVGCCL